jgi:hypothetical protein
MFAQMDVGALDSGKLLMLAIAAVFVFLFWPRITEFFGNLRQAAPTSTDDVADFREQVRALLLRKKAVEAELVEVKKLLTEIEGEMK